MKGALEVDCHRTETISGLVQWHILVSDIRNFSAYIIACHVLCIDPLIFTWSTVPPALSTANANPRPTTPHITAVGNNRLTYCGQNKMANIFQTSFSTTFSWSIRFVSLLKSVTSSKPLLAYIMTRVTDVHLWQQASMMLTFVFGLLLKHLLKNYYTNKSIINMGRPLTMYKTVIKLFME